MFNGSGDDSNSTNQGRERIVMSRSQRPEFSSACWKIVILFGIGFLSVYRLGIATSRRQTILSKYLDKIHQKYDSHLNNIYAPNIFYYHVIDKKIISQISPYFGFLRNMSLSYPHVAINVFFLLDDSKHYKNVIITKRFMASIGPSNADNDVDCKIKSFTKKYVNINVTISSLSRHLANTPLKYNWNYLPISYLTFYARVFSVWQNSGIAFNLPTFFYKYNHKQNIHKVIKSFLTNLNEGTSLRPTSINIIPQEFKDELPVIKHCFNYILQTSSNIIKHRKFTNITKNESIFINKIESDKELKPNFNNTNILHNYLSNTTKNIVLLEANLYNTNNCDYYLRNTTEKIPFLRDTYLNSTNNYDNHLNNTTEHMKVLVDTNLNNTNNCDNYLCNTTEKIPFLRDTYFNSTNNYDNHLNNNTEHMKVFVDTNLNNTNNCDYYLCNTTEKILFLRDTYLNSTNNYDNHLNNTTEHMKVLVDTNLNNTNNCDDYLCNTTEKIPFLRDTYLNSSNNYDNHLNSTTEYMNVLVDTNLNNMNNFDDLNGYNTTENIKTLIKGRCTDNNTNPNNDDESVSKVQSKIMNKDNIESGVDIVEHNIDSDVDLIDHIIIDRKGIFVAAYCRFHRYLSYILFEEHVVPEYVIKHTKDIACGNGEHQSSFCKNIYIL